MLGVEGNRDNLVLDISPSKPKLGGTGALEKEIHKGSGKGPDEKLSPASHQQVKSQEVAGGRPATAAEHGR